MVSDLIQRLGCWAVRASHGAECTGKWKSTGSGGKQRRKKTQGDTGLEAEACLAITIFGGFTGITDGYPSPGYREENEELEEEWSQANGIWPKFCLVGVARESVVRRGFLSFTPRRGLDSAAVLSWGVYMQQPGALPDPVLLPPADWSRSGS